MTSLAILLAGFSVFCAISLALTHFRNDLYPAQRVSRAMGLVLLLALGGLQVAHFAWLYGDLPWVETIPYRLTLFAVAPAFFLFSQPLLRPQPLEPLRPALVGHAAPIVLSPLLPGEFGAFALPLAFVVGAGYMAWLGRSLYALRQERATFRREIVLLGIVFAIAVGVSLLGLSRLALPGKLFYSLYAIAIGAAFFLVQTTLGLRPRLADEVQESAQTAYANSTLTNLDCDALLARLDVQMQNDRLYVDPDLSLPGLAEQLGISPHQLSELLNARLGKSFARYLRERRVGAAKVMLCAEPSASVLSVGLAVGFSAQSNFYEAFRELEGMTPGQYRKLNCRSAAPAAGS